MAINHQTGNRLSQRFGKACLLSLLLILSFIQRSPAEDIQPKNVLLIASYKATAPVGIQWDKGIREGFNASMPGKVNIDVEYIDLSRIRDEHFTQLTLELFRHKYSLLRPDLLITIYNGGLNFLMNHGQELFQDIFDNVMCRLLT